MKKLKDNVLLYDAECPLCRAYSQGFVSAGMLEENGRMNYADLGNELRHVVNMNRARNEIALVNTKSQTVTYGIFSLFAIIGHSFPLLNRVFAWTPFQQVMKRAYSFVSFNRRVIICGNDPENPLACRPDFNLTYRVAYLLFACLVSAVILKNFSPLLGDWWPIPQGWIAELLLVTGQLVFQTMALGLFSSHRSVEKTMEYLGNVMTVSLMGSLLLFPALALYKIMPALSVYVYLAWFAIVVACMFFEHKRRVKVYHLPAYLSYTWVAYRILVGSTYLLLHPQL